MLKRYPDLLGSTVDPNKYSATIKSLSVLAVMILLRFNIDIPEVELETLFMSILVAINGVHSAYVGGRRILNKYFR